MEGGEGGEGKGKGDRGQIREEGGGVEGCSVGGMHPRGGRKKGE